MSNVIEEVNYKVPERFFGFNVFLAAILTERALDNTSAIQTIFFFAMGMSGHLWLINLFNFRLK